IFTAHDRAVVHGDGDLGLERRGRLGGLFGGHHVGARDRQQGNIALDRVHLGDEVGVCRVIDRRAVHLDDEPQALLSLGVEGVAGLSTLVDVVGGDGVDVDFADDVFATVV